MAKDLTAQESDRLMAFFVEACKLGVELDIGRVGMAGTLIAYGQHLLHDDRPLEYYVANPKGAPKWSQ